MNETKAYILGFTTIAFGMFLGYIWSPNYFRFVSNGYNFLYIVGFGVSVWIMEHVFSKLEKRSDNQYYAN